MSSPFRSSARSILAINVHLLMSTGCAAVAWSIWPTTPEGWGLGAISIMLGLAAIIGLGKSLGAMIAVYRKDSTIHDYVARGGEPKSSHMASVSDLKRAGMLDE